MLLNNITTYLNNKSYNINISQNNIYINNFKKIDNITEKQLTILVDNFKLKIDGNNLKVIKMLDKEILFNGQLNKIEIIYNQNDRNNN